MELGKITIRISESVFNRIVKDLNRPHAFASERIGFTFSKHKVLENGGIIIFITDYSEVSNDEYIDDNTVGARIDSNAIRRPLQKIISEKVGCFHVHRHEYDSDVPNFSSIDFIDNPEIIKSFTYGCKGQIHGMMVIGNHGINAMVILPGNNTLTQVNKIVVLSYPLQLSLPKASRNLNDSNQFDRQSFLGGNAQFQISNIHVGIVGLGGGGSHICQQLAHLGITNYTLFDPDTTDITNLNRNVGAQLEDAKNGRAKTDIHERLIRSIIPNAVIKNIKDRWQQKPYELQECDLLVGCVDSYLERNDLEAECRRYLIPLIDMGMDIHNKYEHEPPSMSGQVLLSMPGNPCFHCLGFLTKDKLKQEATKYGDAGGKPQVVWSNGILASHAVGIIIDIITGWSGNKDRIVYTAFDGNDGTLSDHKRLKYYKDKICKHYPTSNCGPTEFIDI